VSRLEPFVGKGVANSQKGVRLVGCGSRGESNTTKNKRSKESGARLYNNSHLGTHFPNNSRARGFSGEGPNGEIGGEGGGINSTPNIEAT